MGWVGRLASRWKYPEQRVWFFVAGWAAVLTVLVVVSSASYSSVILAHTSVELAPSRTVSFTGTTATGALLSSGSVNLTMTLTVSFVLTRSSDAARFGAVQNITEYAAQVRGNGTIMPWLHWVQLVVEVRDLPTPGPDANVFLSSLIRIVLEEGPNLG